ncbi:MAG: hypothetical protein ACRD4E_17780, partial [Bryobacteraceae bacterium]
MIWYRHWIEMRGGLTVAAVCTALVCLAFPGMVYGSTSWFEQSGKIITELDTLRLALPEMGPERFLTWGAHSLLCAVAAIGFGVFLGGTGILTNGFVPGHPSAYYTLTLPVSRFDLIWTRFACACAAAYALLAAMLVFDCGVLLIMGQPIPLGAMLLSTLLAGLLAMTIIAVFVSINLWKEKAGGIAYVAMVALVVNFGWTSIARFVGGQGILWQGIVASVLVIGTALS